MRGEIIASGRGKVQVGSMSLGARVPGNAKGWCSKMAASPSEIVGKLDRGRSQEVRQCTGQEERSSSKIVRSQ